MDTQTTPTFVPVSARFHPVLANGLRTMPTLTLQDGTELVNGVDFKVDVRSSKVHVLTELGQRLVVKASVPTPKSRKRSATPNTGKAKKTGKARARTKVAAKSKAAQRSK